MMKLVIKIDRTEGHVPVLQLCDENEKPLPNQGDLELYNSLVDQAPKVRVTFTVDDRNVVLKGPPELVAKMANWHKELT